MLLDRGFHGVLMLKALQSTGKRFLVRAPVSNVPDVVVEGAEDQVNVELEHEMERSSAPYERMKVNVFAGPCDHEDVEYWAFATNMAITEESAETLMGQFGDRWGIETSYRVGKGFRPKTTSKDLSVRLFFFIFSMLMYNVWVFLNALAPAILVEAVTSETNSRPPITAKYFLGTLRNLYEGFT